MLRFLILSGYFELMMYLQVSGKLDQYINVHYRYLAILSMILSALLALVQLYVWVKSDSAKRDHDEHHHDEHHHEELTMVYRTLSTWDCLCFTGFAYHCRHAFSNS